LRPSWFLAFKLKFIIQVFPRNLLASDSLIITGYLPIDHYTKELGDFTTLLASIIIRHISKSNFLSFFPPKQFHEPSSTCNAETKKKVLNVPKFPPFVALSRNNSVFLPQAHLTLGYLSPFHRFLFTGIKCSNQPLIEKCNQKWDKP